MLCRRRRGISVAFLDRVRLHSRSYIIYIYIFVEATGKIGHARLKRIPYCLANQKVSSPVLSPLRAVIYCLFSQFFLSRNEFNCALWRRRTFEGEASLGFTFSRTEKPTWPYYCENQSFFLCTTRRYFSIFPRVTLRTAVVVVL